MSPNGISRPSQYKPLLFTTTVRNPERIKGFLNILKKYNGQILTDTLATHIEGDLIRFGLYTPLKIARRVSDKLKNNEELTDDEVSVIMHDNPQSHQEAGFVSGWPSRFDTHYKFAKELGFVFYKIDQPIEFSAIGLKFADNDHPEFEQQAFLNAFVKYQSNNPFRRVLNENVPFVLLLSVIEKINADKSFNNSGISRLEIPILLCWRDNNSEALYQRIKELRGTYGYEPSWEVILSVCDELTEGRHSSQKEETIMQELPDEFIRKMRLTGLISIRGFGRFIDHNKKEDKKIRYVLDTYTSYKKYQTEKEYFDYISGVDQRLLDLSFAKKIDIEAEHAMLGKWISHYSWEKIKQELMATIEVNTSSKDVVLKFIPAPLRLEFLIALAVVSKYPNMRIIPNYISDDEGLPSTHAPGNNADIECYEKQGCSLLEVTLLSGAVQVPREMPPITRHLTNQKVKENNTITFFIAPRIHEDTVKWVKFIEYKDNLAIYAYSIGEFLIKLEANQESLYQDTYQMY